VTLCVLYSTTLRFGAAEVPPATFARSAALILAVEALLIASYKRDHHAPGT